MSGNCNDSCLLPLAAASADALIDVACPSEPDGRPGGLDEHRPQKWVASFTDAAGTVGVAGLKTSGGEADVAADVSAALEAVRIVYYRNEGLGGARADALGGHNQLHRTVLLIECVEFGLYDSELLLGSGQQLEFGVQLAAPQLTGILDVLARLRLLLQESRMLLRPARLAGRKMDRLGSHHGANVVFDLGATLAELFAVTHQRPLLPYLLFRDVDFGEKAVVVHHRQPVRVFLVALVRVVGPFPCGVVDVGRLELQAHLPQHVSDPAGLGADLEKDDGVLAVELCERVVEALRGGFEGEVFSLQRCGVEFAEHALALAQVDC